MLRNIPDGVSSRWRPMVAPFDQGCSGQVCDGNPLAINDRSPGHNALKRRPYTARLRKAGSLLLLSLVLLLTLAGCGVSNLIAWSPGWSATAVSDGVVYVGTREGHILALGASGGEEIWRFSPEKQLRLGGVYGTPALGSEFVFVGDRGDREGRDAKDGKLYALKRDRGSNGSIERNQGEWVKPPTEGAIGAIVTGPALAGAQALVLAGSHDGNMYAFQTTGDRPGNMSWVFPTGGQIWSTPVVGDGVAYFGSMDQNIYAVSLDEGTLLWKYETGGAVVSSPLLLDGMVIVGSFDKKLYALGSRTGELLWTFEGDGWFWSSPVSDGKSIFASSMGRSTIGTYTKPGGTVYALDKNGDSLWLPAFNAESPIVSTPAVVGDKLVVGTDGGKLHILSTDSGEKLEVSKDLGRQVKAPLSKEGNMVFVGTENGTVRAIDVDAWGEVWCVDTKDGLNQGRCEKKG